MLQIPFCVLLSQLLIRQKKSHYLYDSCFHQVAICRWVFFSFFEVLARAPSALEVSVVVFTFLTGTWLAAGDLTRGRYTSIRWGFTSRSDSAGRFWILGRCWITDSQFLLVLQLDLKGSEIQKPYVDVVKSCTLWSFLTVEWQLTEDKQAFNLVFPLD